MTRRAVTTPGQVPALTQAALDAGHEPKVVRVGSRFKLVCTCGWSTPSSSKRAQAFAAVADHVATAGLAHLEATGRRAEVVDVPQSVGGRG